MSSRALLRVGLIGDGGISRAVRRAVTSLADPRLEICGVLTRKEPPHTLDSLLAARPDMVVECASHAAVSEYGELVLRAGVDLLVTSIGSLADPGLEDRLIRAARQARARLILTPGAIGGIDALAAARLGGLHRVCYRGRKPPLAWKDTPAEQQLDLATITEPTPFYKGNAREAARLFPKNSNVAATVALAGVGFERTEVELLADPTVQRNVHELVFEGNDGCFEMRMEGVPSPENPRTSLLTAHSIVRILTGLVNPVVI